MRGKVCMPTISLLEPRRQVVHVVVVPAYTHDVCMCGWWFVNVQRTTNVVDVDRGDD